VYTNGARYDVDVRRGRRELAEETAQDLQAALLDLGLAVGDVAAPVESDSRAAPDFVLRIGDQLLAVEVKPVVTALDSRVLIERAWQSGLPFLVASERIADSARAALREAGIGYFDRRGHLRLVLEGIFVDTEVPGRPPRSTGSAPLSSETAKEVALVLLEEPEARPGVRAIARVLDRSPSSVSDALEGLRAAGLATTSNEPLVPDLFWEVEAVWRREPVPLTELPRPGEAGRTDQLQLGLGHGDASGWTLDDVGWALTDTLAAVAWGVPIVASADYPPDFYVPSQAVLSRALSTLGPTPRPSDRACTVALAPARIVCRRRVSRQNESWPVASHIVVALDLAKDRARGRDALERWNPEHVARVW
jgi:hypothetical protein